MNGALYRDSMFSMEFPYVMCQRRMSLIGCCC